MLPTRLTKTASAVGSLAVDNLSRWKKDGVAVLISAATPITVCDSTRSAPTPASTTTPEPKPGQEPVKE